MPLYGHCSAHLDLILDRSNFRLPPHSLANWNISLIGKYPIHFRVNSLRTFPCFLLHASMSLFLSNPRSYFHHLGNFPSPAIWLPCRVGNKISWCFPIELFIIHVFKETKIENAYGVGIILFSNKYLAGFQSSWCAVTFGHINWCSANHWSLVLENIKAPSFLYPLCSSQVVAISL